MVLLIVVALGGAWFFQKYQIVSRPQALDSAAVAPAENNIATPTSTEQIALAPLDAVIQFASLDMSEETASGTIRAFYPQIINPATDGQKKFNDTIKAMVENFVAQFKKESLSAIDISGAKNSFTWAYDLKYQDKNLISVLMSGEQYISGSAHPSHPMTVLNFDLTTGKIITLADIFQPEAKYLDTLSNFSRQELETRNAKSKFTDEKDILSGTKPKDENFAMFNLSADGLVISFPEYQVAPYVAGISVVTMPWSGLKDILADKAPFKWFASSTSSPVSNN